MERTEDAVQAGMEEWGGCAGKVGWRAVMAVWVAAVVAWVVVWVVAMERVTWQRHLATVWVGFWVARATILGVRQAAPSSGDGAAGPAGMASCLPLRRGVFSVISPKRLGWIEMDILGKTGFGTICRNGWGFMRAVVAEGLLYRAEVAKAGLGRAEVELQKEEMAVADG